MAEVAISSGRKEVRLSEKLLKIRVTWIILCLVPVMTVVILSQRCRCV